MAWSKGEALTDPAIRDPIIFLSEYRFHLPDIPVEIIMRLYRPLHSGNIIVRRSHNLVVENIEPAAPASADTDLTDEGEALHKAVDELVSVFNGARNRGLKPHASWLKASDDFP